MKKLSELDSISCWDGEMIKNEEYHTESDLRAWFIKIIKELRKNRSSNPDYSKQELNGIEKWIMANVPLSEEDLT